MSYQLEYSGPQLGQILRSWQSLRKPLERLGLAITEISCQSKLCFVLEIVIIDKFDELLKTHSSE
jgi:hypothetical protein